MQPQRSNLIGALLSLAAFAVYATHDVLIKFLGSNYSPFQIVFFMGLLGFPLVTLVLMRDRTDGTLIPKLPLWTAIRASATVMGSLCGFYALSVLPLAQCYAIFFAMPILVTLMAIPLLGEKIGLHRGVAILVGLMGVVVLLRPGVADLILGHLAAFGAAFFGGAASVIVRKVGNTERAVVLIIYPMMASLLLMSVAMPFVYVPMPLAHLAMTAIIAALGLAGGLLLIAAYRRAPAIIVAPMHYSQIIWAVLYGYFLFDEQIDFFTGVGTAIIIVSGLYIVLREQTPSASNAGRVLKS